MRSGGGVLRTKELLLSGRGMSIGMRDLRTGERPRVTVLSWSLLLLLELSGCWSMEDALLESKMLLLPQSESPEADSEDEKWASSAMRFDSERLSFLALASRGVLVIITG